MHQSKYRLNVSTLECKGRPSNMAPQSWALEKLYDRRYAHVWVCGQTCLEHFLSSKLWCNLPEVERHPSEWDRTDQEHGLAETMLFLDRQNTWRTPRPIWRGKGQGAWRGVGSPLTGPPWSLHCCVWYPARINYSAVWRLRYVSVIRIGGYDISFFSSE